MTGPVTDDDPLTGDDPVTHDDPDATDDDPASHDDPDATDVVRAALAASGAPWEESEPGRFTVSLPGERKQRTSCSLAVRERAVLVNAFVARHPDENHEAVYRWLLEQNARMYAVAFAVDRAGDIYLVGRVPRHSVTPDEVDRVLGAVLSYADGAFNTILELGFATSIRAEWRWRLARGESTANLGAFEHLRPPGAAG